MLIINNRHNQVYKKESYLFHFKIAFKCHYCNTILLDMDNY